MTPKKAKNGTAYQIESLDADTIIIHVQGPDGRMSTLSLDLNQSWEFGKELAEQIMNLEECI